MDKEAIGLWRVQQFSNLCVARPYQIKDKVWEVKWLTDVQSIPHLAALIKPPGCFVLSAATFLVFLFPVAVAVQRTKTYGNYCPHIDLLCEQYVYPYENISC